MNQIGVQTQNIVYDGNPAEGFQRLQQAGFSCADFSLNTYLSNTMLYQGQLNSFFDKTTAQLESFFGAHKRGAKEAGISIAQMHMPYPNFIPGGGTELNDYLQNVVAPKSMEVCAFLECPYIVMHGFKLVSELLHEEAEWQRTQKFLEFLAPAAKEMGITICIENLYTSAANHLVEGPCCDAKKAAERIDRINEKYGAEILGFCFDTGHANLVGIDFEEFITTLGKRLKVLHIHDNDGVNDLHQIPFTFTRSRENRTTTDWEGFVRGLRAISYDGVLNFETAPVLTAFPEDMKLEVLAFIAKIGRHFAEKLSE